MVSTVKSRPNHYEVLGLSPSASQEEIAEAYARGMSQFRPHTFGTLAQLSVAYETLRDPARRRAYDASLGLNRRLAPRQPAMPAVSFSGTARWEPMVRAVIEPALSPQAPSPEPPRAEDPLERRLAAIAASVRELAKPRVEEVPADQSRLTQSVALARPEPSVPDLPPLAVAPEPHAEQPLSEQPFEWRKPALAVGGFVLAAGLVGALAGLSVKDDAQQPALSVALPAAKPRPQAAAPAPVPETGVAFVPTVAAQRPLRTAYAPARTRRSAEPHRAPSWSEDVAGQIQTAETAPAQAQPAVAVTDPLAPQAPAAPAVAASMPLPNKVIARTIERIGYACGSVASTSAVEGGAPGVFNVTCTSGHSYQAAPVRGRYHFRRLGSR